MTPRVWPSEFGYQLLFNSSVVSDSSLTHAAATAQSLLLLRSNAHVERFFLFCATGGQDIDAGQYGIWRGTTRPSMYPLPAVAAFATAAWLTDSPGFDTGEAISMPAAGRLAVILFRAQSQSQNPGQSSNGLNTIAVWLDGASSVGPMPSLRKELQLVAVEVASIVTALGRVLHNSSTTTMSNTNTTLSFDCTALPSYIRVAPAATALVLAQLAGSSSR